MHLSIGSWIPSVKGSFIYLGMPVVAFYHVLCSHLFFSCAATDADGLEWAGNQLMAPFHYVLCARRAEPTGDPYLPYEFTHRYSYDDEAIWWKTAAAVLATPWTLPPGLFLKGLSYLSEGTRQRHQALVQADTHPIVRSNLPYYRKELGLELLPLEMMEELSSQGYPRRPGDELHLVAEKRALGEIAKLLMGSEVPFWCDCGTCLGSWRHGGVIPWDEDIDIAIFQPDFDNVRRLLTAGLDPEEYQVQDWSSRDKPKSYLKVYVKETRALIDIYCYAIDRQNKVVNYVLANEENIFLPESWKERERRYKTPVPFSWLFPFRRGQFDGIDLPVPNETELYLKLRYGQDISPARVYDPMTDGYQPDLRHPYWQRSHVY